MKSQHWSSMIERGSYLGLKIMLLSYRILGHRITSAMMFLVMAYFYHFAKTARSTSQQYLTLFNKKFNPQNPIKLSSYRHFLSFGDAILDKFAVYTGKITVKNVDFVNSVSLLEKVKANKGFVIFTAHLGNMEIARALSQAFPEIKINALVFTEHALKINAILKQLNPNFDINLIQLNTLDVKLAIQLQEKIDHGEIIIIAADRTSVTNPAQVVPAMFLGKCAYFPQGPFILSHLLQTETYFMLCLKIGFKRYEIIFDAFEKQIKLPLGSRQRNLQHYVDKYSNLLEKYCYKYPYQWFNFFDFWQRPSQHKYNKKRNTQATRITMESR